ncbi:bifunctional Exoribonuclease [Babesia duncani]|uniref:Bifunctional Exoribonuclease n=1 Tax=Babesia duncani TaxID=323732 RepID=A0AAD9PL29_9APIC|nr:bifunctional Exoribonuclease [Babesia duncani]KAK2196829.1 bifunctional Exoribonuclease [Babesia duncani]
MTIAEFIRLDGRPPGALRPQLIEFGPLGTGPSCKIVMGNTGEGLGIGKCTCVIGLLLCGGEGKSRNTVCNYHKPTFEVFLRTSTGTPKAQDRGIESIVLKVLQNLVNANELGKITISLRLQVIENSGGLLAACINAMVGCLHVSGLKLHSLPWAITFGIVQEGISNKNLVILDPTTQESKEYCKTTLTILCEANTGTISLTTIDSGCGGFDNSAGTQIQHLAQKTAMHCIKHMESAYFQSMNASKITFETMGI